jgi:hypothetical protein
MKMKKIMLLLVVVVLAAVFILGCTRGPNYNYPTGYAAGQPLQQNPQYQGYVGGGCNVAGAENSMPLDVSEPSMAA